MKNTDLKQLREKYNLTQQDVANGINADRSRISQWENGKYTISKAYVALLEIFFSKFEK